MFLFLGYDYSHMDFIRSCSIGFGTVELEIWKMGSDGLEFSIWFGFFLALGVLVFRFG